MMETVRVLDRCVLEIDGADTGVLVRVEEVAAYRFYAADQKVAKLDGRLFTSPRRAEAEVRRVLALAAS